MLYYMYMRFAVPQFIDVEDKIFGPLTWRQFVYLAGGGGLCFVLWRLLPTFFAILLIIPVGGFAGALAFVKINNRPFIDMVESAFNFLLRNKLYIWKKEQKKKEDTKQKQVEAIAYVPTISQSKLHDISWGLDVLDSKKNQ